VICLLICLHLLKYHDTYLAGDTDGEFIRIHNPTESSINVGGGQITDREDVIAFPAWTPPVALNSFLCIICG